MATQTPDVAGESVEGLTIRFHREGEEPQLLELLQASFDGWPHMSLSVPPIEHLRWKLSTGGTPLRTVVAVIGSELVGSCLVTAKRVLVRGTVLQALRAADVAVHPDYRGRGIAGQVLAFTDREVAATFDLQIGGPAAHPALRILNDRQGRLPFGNQAQVLALPLTFGAAARTYRLTKRRDVSKLARSAGEVGRWLLGRARPRPSGEAAWTVREAAAFDDRIDVFWREASHAFDYILVRDREYLNTRFDPRAGNFTIRLAESGPNILGYAVLSTTRSGETGRIGDLLTLPGREDVARSLVLDALQWFRRVGATTALFLLPARHPYRRALHDLGFRRRREQRALAYRPMRLGAEAFAFLADPHAAIHLSYSDDDGV